MTCNLLPCNTTNSIDNTDTISSDCELRIVNCALLLGGNMGNREGYIDRAIELINDHIGVVTIRSKFYESEAWGFDCDDKFINVAIVVETAKTPIEILKAVKEIEKELGRIKLKKDGYESRVIDIDIIFYDELILDSPELTIPHKLMHKREFVLSPMREIIPNYIHPVLKTRIKELVISD